MSLSKQVKILDCTLRDGGYVNNWNFDNKAIVRIVQSLVDCGIEIIECGFLSQQKGKDFDSSMFSDIGILNQLLGQVQISDDQHTYCAMINLGEYEVADLPMCQRRSDQVTGIRLAFHKEYVEDAAKAAQVICDKGYKLFVQPMVTPAYTDAEILALIETFNKLDIFAMYIVDSFGSMFKNDFQRFLNLFEHNLKDDVHLGYHAHNNLQLAYSNAIDFTEKVQNTPIIIDSSIYGMGRGAGNLNTELLADYLNKQKGYAYNIVYLLETIDNYLEAIYRENYWGYSAAHFLSATIGCHPNYATYLIEKKSLTIVSIMQILDKITPEKRRSFQKDYIEQLYLDFKSTPIAQPNIPKDLFADQTVVVMASGKSTKDNIQKINEFVSERDAKLVAVNHIPFDFVPDYFYFSNQKRYDEFEKDLESNKLIVTSNVAVQDSHTECLVCDYSELVAMTSHKCDNVSVLLLNMLIKQSIGQVYLAGLDGYDVVQMDNYSYKEYGQSGKRKMQYENEQVLKALQEIRPRLDIHFLTPSIFEQELQKK